jgi:hypothetical protein
VVENREHSVDAAGRQEACPESLVSKFCGGAAARKEDGFAPRRHSIRDVAGIAERLIESAARVNVFIEDQCDPHLRFRP